MSAKFRGEAAPSFHGVTDQLAWSGKTRAVEESGSRTDSETMTMDMSGSDNPAPLPVGHEAADELDGESEAVEISAGANGVSLEELVAQLEQDPGECRRACEGLESVDVETRVSIIEGLAGISAGAGVIRLLQTSGSLGERRDPGSRAGCPEDSRRQGRQRSQGFQRGGRAMG